MTLLVLLDPSTAFVLLDHPLLFNLKKTGQFFRRSETLRFLQNRKKFIIV